MEESTLPFDIGLFYDVSLNWPESGNHIIGSFDTENIILYQAVSSRIAVAAVSTQSFRNNFFKVNWGLRTCLLSAVYASDWGKKGNASNIVAIAITREGFEQILWASQQGSHKDETCRLEWHQSVDIEGRYVERREPVLYLKARILDPWIRRVTDVTLFVSAMRRALYQDKAELLMIPDEAHLQLDEQLADIIGAEHDKLYSEGSAGEETKSEEEEVSEG